MTSVLKQLEWTQRITHFSLKWYKSQLPFKSVFYCTLVAWALCSRDESEWDLLLWGLAEGIRTTGLKLSSRPLSFTALMCTKNERYFPPAMPTKGNERKICDTYSSQLLHAALYCFFFVLFSVSLLTHCWMGGSGCYKWLVMDCSGEPLRSLGLVRLSIPACPDRSSPLDNHTGPHKISSLCSCRNGHSLEPETDRDVLLKNADKTLA